MSDFADRSHSEFADALAADSPTPGGGSAAALTGAMAAAAVEMVCQVTLGDDEFAEVHDDLADRAADLRSRRETLSALADEDAAAFNDVMAAYRRSSDDPDRQSAIQAAMTTAAEVPLETATQCLAIIEHAEVAARDGNQNAVTDAGTGALLAHAALRSALYNVDINLGSIDDEATVASLTERRESIAAEADELLAGVESLVQDAI